MAVGLEFFPPKSVCWKLSLHCLLYVVPVAKLWQFHPITTLQPFHCRVFNVEIKSELVPYTNTKLKELWLSFSSFHPMGNYTLTPDSKYFRRWFWSYRFILIWFPKRKAVSTNDSSHKVTSTGVMLHYWKLSIKPFFWLCRQAGSCMSNNIFYIQRLGFYGATYASSTGKKAFRAHFRVY